MTEVAPLLSESWGEGTESGETRGWRTLTSHSRAEETACSAAPTENDPEEEETALLMRFWYHRPAGRRRNRNKIHQQRILHPALLRGKERSRGPLLKSSSSVLRVARLRNASSLWSSSWGSEAAEQAGEPSCDRHPASWGWTAAQEEERRRPHEGALGDE